MAEKSPKELIKCLHFVDNIPSEVNPFDSRKHLFDFDMNSTLTLSDDQIRAIPVLKEEFCRNRKRLDINLKEGMTEAIENNKLIKNYENARKDKWIQFLECLKIRETIAEEKPTFVTLSPIISDMFAPEVWDSTFFALKFNGVIYLFRNESLKMDEDVNKEVTPNAYYIHRLRDLVTDMNDSEMDCFTKIKSVDRIDLKNNKLIVCSDIIARERNGSPVHIKCRQIFFKEEYKKLLYDWSVCVISGIPTLIRGKRYKEKLQKIDALPVRTIPDMRECRDYWSDTKCFSFVDQSLEFIKSCVDSDSELQLFEFQINSRDKTMTCFKHDMADNSKHFLPDFYTQ